MSQSRTGRRIAPWFVAVGVAVALGGCATGSGSASPSATPPATSLTTPVPTAELDGPPDALLGAEGGDPVAGQLGTYTWGDGGSDSPWLPGAPIAVGAGEPLAVTMDPDAATESWTAIYVPASADGPAGGLDLGAGVGSPAFAAPGAGSWTVDLEVVFADGAGTAHYAWRLDVE
ncbi:MAG: hypothetical protein ACSLFN_04125 [Candidatus Limnocylindrales bacterium]